MTKHETIRGILDAATLSGRLEEAIEVLDKYAEQEALGFTNYIELGMTPTMWVNKDGSYKTFEEVYADYKKKSK